MRSPILFSLTVVIAYVAQSTIASGEPITTGEWRNTDSRSIVRVVITKVKDKWQIQAWGSCKPDPCDWGQVQLHIVRGQSVMGEHSHGFARFNNDSGIDKYATIHLVRGVLRIECVTLFTDDADHNYQSVHELAKMVDATDTKQPVVTAEDADDETNAQNLARYDVPKTEDIRELLKFVVELHNYRPQKSEEIRQDRKHRLQAVKGAAEQLLKLKRDKSEQELYESTSLLLLRMRAQTMYAATPAEQLTLVEEVKQRLAAREEPFAESSYLSIAQEIASNLEFIGDKKLAVDAYSNFGDAFEESKQPKIAKMGAQFKGAARRLDLVGKPIKIEGKTVGGKEFDWDEYRGKVVLIDFWATWCGPCRAELPNVERAYREYHDRGFDVVGVSIDDDTEALEKDLAERKLPWVTLHDKGQEDSHPLAISYGVFGVPTVFLVGREGNVISLNVRGDKLWEHLAELIGPPTGENTNDEKSNVKPAEASTNSDDEKASK